MDERFRGKSLWVGLGALAIVFLCVMMCGAGVFTMFAARQVPAYAPVPQVQPPAGGESVAPPPATYYGHGPMGMGRHGGFNPIGTMFKLFFFGLMLLLFAGLIKRLFWGRRHWAHHYRGPGLWGPHYKGKPPEGDEWKHKPHPPFGPWGWHNCAEQDKPASDPAAEEEDSEASESEYTGPQE